MRGTRSTVATLLLVGAVGCGPVQSTTLIVEAQAELTAAQTAGGAKHAPFETVAAEEYLHKAREEQSYADFDVAIRFARRSRDCARAAHQLADAATQTVMGVAAPAPKRSLVCRAGVDRGPGSLAPAEEPAARGVSEQEPTDPTPEEPAKVTQEKPRGDEPADPEPAKDDPKVKKDAGTRDGKDAPAKDTKDDKAQPDQGSDEPLPQGDE